MAPRNYMNPAPQTESAREAAKSFYCDLCGKGYSRQPELDNHITSYDHQHRKRLRDLKEASQDPSRTERQRRKEDAEAGLVRLDFGSNKASTDGKSTGEKKKGGFKPMTMKRQEEPAPTPAVEDQQKPAKAGFKQIGRGAPEKSKFDNIKYPLYDPSKPTE